MTLSTGTESNQARHPREILAALTPEDQKALQSILKIERAYLHHSDVSPGKSIGKEVVNKVEKVLMEGLE
jgi:hypothetical protein